ncbi:TetR/AcrR family transcriptional regulator [Actinomycetospora aeridis]|uniref:TetR family transcriptional regulator C-terminal domain-containing protein n=1 Tax=Actinomycetospora aeridis TaxID=3129231 RepID=A0ABU8NEB6_9PSEU
MDKTAGTDDPRDRLDAAVTALIAEEGLAGVSVRKVAARAGVSVGMVQHHHPTKRDMLAAAAEAVSRSFAARTERAVTGLPPREALRELCRQLLPLDAARADEGRVWLAFVAAAAVDDDLAARHTRGWRELEDLLAELVARCRHDGDDIDDADRAHAAGLLATLDGLAVGGVVEPGRLPPERLEALLAGALRACEQ